LIDKNKPGGSGGLPRLPEDPWEAPALRPLTLTGGPRFPWEKWGQFWVERFWGDFVVVVPYDSM